MELFLTGLPEPFKKNTLLRRSHLKKIHYPAGAILKKLPCSDGAIFNWSAGAI